MGASATSPLRDESTAAGRGAVVARADFFKARLPVPAKSGSVVVLNPEIALMKAVRRRLFRQLACLVDHPQLITPERRSSAA
jgi:hypothetical protein